MKSNRAIVALRFISGLVMAVGLTGVIDGFVHYKTVPLFMFNVPTWVIALTVLYMGLRYWRRIPELEKKVQRSEGFSWSNFPLLKGR